MKQIGKIVLMAAFSCSVAFGQTTEFAPGQEGGGGDASEMRVNEIRADLLNWINSNGSKGLDFKSLLTLEEYNEKMKSVLEPKKVVLGFVEKDSETDPELQVSVNGVPKTCRGFRSKVDNRLKILCNTKRFEKTPQSAQYRLIHHEYAGLVGVEKNDGAASDYFLSEQITDYLQATNVLRLGVVKAQSTPVGSTLRSTEKAKTMELFYFDDFFARGQLSEIEMKAWKNLCKDATTQYTEKFLGQFSYDDLVVGTDVKILAKLNQTMIQPYEAYYGCRVFLETTKVNYTVVKKNFEFLNAQNCEEPLDRTKQWRANGNHMNEVFIDSKFIKIDGSERRSRQLPRNTKACIVTIMGVEAY